MLNFRKHFIGRAGMFFGATCRFSWLISLRSKYVFDESSQVFLVTGGTFVCVGGPVFCGTTGKLTLG